MLNSVLLIFLQWETVWEQRWRGTSWQTSITRLLSSCTMVSQPENWVHYCLISLNFRNFSSVLSCDLPSNQIWLKLGCICSIPDRREVVFDPWLSQRRRSLHQTLQRGQNASSYCGDFAGPGSDWQSSNCSLSSLSLYVTLSVCLMPPRWCSQRRMWSFI